MQRLAVPLVPVGLHVASCDAKQEAPTLEHLELDLLPPFIGHDEVHVRAGRAERARGHLGCPGALLPTGVTA